jgi:hypothetical protein
MHSAGKRVDRPGTRTTGASVGITATMAPPVRTRGRLTAARAAAGVLLAATSLSLAPLHDAALAVALPPGPSWLAAAMTGPSSPGSQTAPPPVPLWLVKSNDLILLQRQAAADGVTLPAFTWVGCGGKSDRDRCVAGQQPIFTSYWALRAKALAGWSGTAIFDIETWHDTPAAERADPVRWICRAARLSMTDRRLKVIITPYAKPPMRVMIPEDVAAARCGSYAVDVQSQFINGEPARFGRFIRRAVRAIRRINDGIIILAGLATNQPGVQKAAHLAADYRKALAAGVQGFWLNARNWGSRNACAAAQGGPGCPQVAIEFLKDIGLIKDR